MKKMIPLALVLLLTLSLLTACADSGGSSNNSSTSTPAKTNTPIQRTVEVPDKPLDLTDDSIYFVIIDGVKINLQKATVQDFLDIGFVFNENKDDEGYFDENSMIDANSALDHGFSFGANLYKEGTRSFIEVYAVNLTNRSQPLKDCEIGSVYFDERIGSAFDISTVCNLSYGCTEEEIKSVFGDIADDMFSQTAYENNQIRYYAADHGEFWFLTKDTGSGVFRQVGVHTAKQPER